MERVTTEQLADGHVNRLSFEQLERLENELQGVFLDPGYGCERVEYSSIFRVLIDARAEIERLRGVVIQRGRVHHGEFFPEPANDRFDLRTTDELDGLDWSKAEVIIRKAAL